MQVFGGIMGYESFLSGATGWVAVGSNIMPKEFQQLFTMTYDEQNLAEARKIYTKILPIIRLVGGHRYVSATKAALNKIGKPVGLPRSPRLPLPIDDLPMLDNALRLAGVLSDQ